MNDLHQFYQLAMVSDAIKTSWDFLMQGGLFMIPLAVTAFVGVTAIVFKWLSLSRSRVMPNALVSKVASFGKLKKGAAQKAVISEFATGDSTLARLSNVAVRHRGKPQRDIILSVEAAAREEASRLHAGIGVLDIVITVAPLLGLLGTASGLVTIFQGLSDTADHLAIAQGIAKALNTTIIGLTIAVPCVVAHGYFTRKIEVYTARLESLLADLAHDCQEPQSKSS